VVESIRGNFWIQTPKQGQHYQTSYHLTIPMNKKAKNFANIKGVQNRQQNKFNKNKNFLLSRIHISMPILLCSTEKVASTLHFTRLQWGRCHKIENLPRCRCCLTSHNTCNRIGGVCCCIRYTCAAVVCFNWRIISHGPILHEMVSIKGNSILNGGNKF